MTDTEHNDFDEADAERLLNLNGDLAQTVERARLAGCDPADAIICLGFLIGELAAGLPGSPPLVAILSSVGNAAHSGHRKAVAKAAAAARSRAREERY